MCCSRTTSSKPRPICLESSTLPLSHCAPRGGPMFFLGKLYNFSRFQRRFNILRGGGGGVQRIPGGGIHRNLSKLGFSMQGVQCRGPRPSIPASGSTHVGSLLTSSLVRVIDLHILFVYELGRTGRSFLKPHRCHSAVSLSKTHLSFNPGRPVPK